MFTTFGRFKTTPSKTDSSRSKNKRNYFAAQNLLADIINSFRNDIPDDLYENESSYSEDGLAYYLEYLNHVSKYCRKEDDNDIDPRAFWKKEGFSFNATYKMDEPRALSFLDAESSTPLVDLDRIHFLLVKIDDDNFDSLSDLQKINIQCELLVHVYIVLDLYKLCHMAEIDSKRKTTSRIKNTSGFNEELFERQLRESKDRLESASEQIIGWYENQKSLESKLDDGVNHDDWARDNEALHSMVIPVSTSEETLQNSRETFSSKYSAQVKTKFRWKTQGNRYEVINQLDESESQSQLKKVRNEDDNENTAFYAIEHAHHLRHYYGLDNKEQLLYFYKLSLLALYYQQISSELKGNFFSKNSVLKDLIVEKFKDKIRNVPKHFNLSAHECNIETIIHSPRFSFIASMMLHKKLGLEDSCIQVNTLTSIAEQHYMLKMYNMRPHAGELGTCFSWLCSRQYNVRTVEYVKEMTEHLLNHRPNLALLEDAYSKRIISNKELLGDTLHRQLTLAILIVARRSLQDDKANGFVKHQLDNIYAQLDLPVCHHRSLKELSSSDDVFNPAERLIFRSRALALDEHNDEASSKVPFKNYFETFDQQLSSNVEVTFSNHLQ